MHEVVEGRWEQARKMVIARWREIVKRVEARDEPGVLVLANIIDEFCEEAIATRLEVLHGRAPLEVGVLRFPKSAGLTETRCVFCRGFQEQDGCFGMLASLNSLVTAGKWDDARRVAEKYIARLESMSLADVVEPHIH